MITYPGREEEEEKEKKRKEKKERYVEGGACNSQQKG